MNKFRLYFILFCSVFILFSCNKADSITEVPVRAYDVQYEADIAIIKKYLNTHYLDYTNEEVTISKITDPLTQIKMMDYLDSPTYPKLLVKEVVSNDVTYEIYYFKLRADYEPGIAPSKADEVLTSYNGTYLKEVDDVETTTITATQFEYTPFPTSYLRLDAAVRGWREIIPLFKAGQKTDVSGQPTSYNDFGAGIIFIPSGLGYFNVPQSSLESNVVIPSYSPLVFSFKLYDVRFADQDGDGILSNDEDLDRDGDFTNDDTDDDGIQNLYDIDDDGDGIFTLTEIKRPDIYINGVKTSNGYYPYNGAANDDPATPFIDERQGIPRKFTGPIDEDTDLPTPVESDFTDPTRLRRHLDATSLPPYE